MDILCAQETKSRSLGAEFKLFYHGVDGKTNGVGVMLKEEFVRNVLEVKRVTVMSLKIEIEGVMFIQLVVLPHRQDVSWKRRRNSGVKWIK